MPKITYQLKLAEKPELEKQPSKRKNQVRILTLSADLDWDSLKAQILVKIDECLKPRALDFGNYDVCFTVPRKVSDPTPLGTDEDYEFLRTNVLKMSEKTAHIYICTRKVSKSVSVISMTRNANLPRMLPQFPRLRRKLLKRKTAAKAQVAHPPLTHRTMSLALIRRMRRRKNARERKRTRRRLGRTWTRRRRRR